MTSRNRTTTAGTGRRWSDRSDDTDSSVYEPDLLAEEEADVDLEESDEIDASDDEQAEFEIVEEDRDDGDDSPISNVANTLGTGGGLLLAVSGLFMALISGASGDLRTTIASFGLSPGQLVLIGLLVTGLTRLRSRLIHQELALGRMHARARRTSTAATQLLKQVQYLVEAELGRAESRNEDLESMRAAIHLIERQDEKINNLSKATKMYGKPLLEISNQISDSSRQVSEVQATLAAIKLLTEQGHARGDAARGDGQLGADGDVLIAIQSFERILHELSRRLIQKADDISNDVAAASEKSKAQLTTLSDDLGKNTERLAADLTQVDEHVQQARAAIVESLEQVAAGGGPGSSDLGETLGRIQGELSTLGNSIANMRLAPAADGDAEAGATATTKATGDAKPSVANAIAKLKQLRS